MKKIKLLTIVGMFLITAPIFGSWIDWIPFFGKKTEEKRFNLDVHNNENGYCSHLIRTLGAKAVFNEIAEEQRIKEIEAREAQAINIYVKLSPLSIDHDDDIVGRDTKKSSEEILSGKAIEKRKESEVKMNCSKKNRSRGNILVEPQRRYSHQSKELTEKMESFVIKSLNDRRVQLEQKIFATTDNRTKYKLEQEFFATYIKELIALGYVNMRDYNGNTLLYYAMITENANAVRQLVKAQANPNIKNSVGDTPLLAVIKKVRDMQEEDSDGDIFSEIHHGIDDCIIEILKLNPDLRIKNDNKESVLLILQESNLKKNNGMLKDLLSLVKGNRREELVQAPDSIRKALEEHEKKHVMSEFVEVNA